jgi:energy-coupling factor transport system substrate-specific component
MRTGRLLLGIVVAAALALAVWAALAPHGVDWGTLSFVWAGALVLAGVALYGLRAAPAQELSLVAALSALATASRVLFASLPNVKPVTFIVLISGVGLGPGPGFMVGATTALVSNFFFGQGPWTPWQMLAWGAVGAVGGLLGHKGRAHGGAAGEVRTPGRWTLVTVGALCALAFDWAVTIWMFVAFSAHTWPALLALYAQGLPFDFAHVAATALFAALFGEQAVTIVTRFRSRTHVTFLDSEAAS